MSWNSPLISCTKIIIGQRISAVKDADQILVLENGRVNLKKYGINVEEMLAQRELEHN